MRILNHCTGLDDNCSVVASTKVDLNSISRTMKCSYSIMYRPLFVLPLHYGIYSSPTLVLTANLSLEKGR